ncbi:DUF423 domain-containing protein [Myroides sp. LJL119]
MTHLNLALLFGGLYGALGVICGAFGAHLLKNKLTPERLESYLTGVKYQMYHAVLLVVLSLFEQLPYIKWAIVALIIGVFLFSFSIYGLVLSATFGKKLSFLGPITPLGGLCLVAGWILIVVSSISM